MVALRNARVRRYVLLCHFFCFWHFAARTLQFSALPHEFKAVEGLSGAQPEDVPSWIREQMCDLGYDKGVSDNMAEALSFYSPSALVEASRESLLGALQQTFPNDAQRMIMAQSLYDRIQKGITQPQPVSWQRLALVVARVRCVLFLVDVRQGLCFCGCFAWFQVQSNVPENVKAFTRALDDAELEGQILRTETGSFKLEQDSEIWDEKQFYVRDCYTKIADIMLKKKPHRMSLLGSSGIGKSNFMVYLIWRRFQDSELKDFPVFLHKRDDIFRFKKGEEPKLVDVRTLKSTQSTPQQALYIMDADIDVEHGVFCQSLWITSARRPDTAASNTEHFKNADNCGGQFFMPPWALEEMLSEEVVALHKLTTEEVVEKRFGIFGGTARLVLRLDETRAGVDRRKVVEAVQSADALQCLKVSSDMKALSKTTHLLVKMMPWPDFSWFDVHLSSPYVRQELVKQNRGQRAEELWKRIAGRDDYGHRFCIV